MRPADLLDFLRHSGRDPSRLIFEDELTGIHNRRFLHSYFEHKVRWESGTDFPLSLLLLDLDRFKEVNDSRGHAAGDQLLAWIASVLREVAGASGLPVRFGGDEFVLLLPRTDRAPAFETAARLLQRLRDRPFRLRDSGTEIAVSVSIGVATAPSDAKTGRELLQAADTALYHAKQSGRDQAASVTEVDPHKVFPRAALHRLQVTGIVGRDDELRVVSEALLALGRGQNQFVLFEGPDGIGKTTLLAAIGRSLAGHETFAMAHVACDGQEAYRPYYLATRILVALLSQRADKGAGVIQSLTEQEVAHLSHIVPRVGAAAPALTEADERARRRHIFAALARLLPRVVDRRPLVLLVDDLHLADEATLLLLQTLLQGDKQNLLVCGTTLKSTALLERVYGAGAPDSGVQRVKLGALSTEHIGHYLRSVFPNLRMPAGFAAKLAAVTHGNPQFLSGIVRKLVADRKVALVGSDWVIESPTAEYLPGSFEEIVKQEIAALDADSRRLLEHAATLGKDVPVSMLAGSAQLNENRVLDFVDRAEALGLVRADFQVNDEVLRFQGKGVMDASYGAMDERRRAALHERVGAHQEALYQERALSSPSLLAHHFERAAKPEKAARYAQAQHAYAGTVFNPEEAARYTVELEEVDEDPEALLSPQAIALVPKVIRTFMAAARNVRLYPTESKKTEQALEQFRHAIDEILVTNRWLQLSRDRDRLRANNRPLDASKWSALGTSFRELLDRFELQSLTFERDLTVPEVRKLLVTFVQTTPAALGPGFWKRIVAEHGLSRVRPEQVRYSQVLRIRAGEPLRPEPDEAAPGPEELAGIPKILRALQAAAQIAKLYPPDAPPVAPAVEQLHAAVQHALRSQQSLTLASVGHTLLANGVRVDTREYDVVAKAVVELLDGVGLESITFHPDVPKADLAALVAGLREAPPDADRRFWVAFARNRALSGLGINQRRYAVSGAHRLLREAAAPDDAGSEPAARAATEPAARTATEPPAPAPTEPAARAATAERLVAEPLAALQQALPAFGKELLVTGEQGLVRGLLRRLFERFQEQDAAVRSRTVATCRALFNQLILGLRHTFAGLAAEFLLAALATERTPHVLRELGDLLRVMAGNAVQFSDYQLATRILLALSTRQRQLREPAGPDGDGHAAATLSGWMDPAAVRLLEDDIRSGQPERQEPAARVLGALGEVGVPLLIDVIKRENDFRVRQLAAQLIADAGSAGPEQIKRSLATEVIVEQRARLLDVIDTVTSDLRNELQQCFYDPAPRVRRAAYELFERLQRDDLIDLIVPFAREGQPAAARATIRALARHSTPAAVEALSSILDTTRDSRVAALCCQALGRSEHPAAIDALARTLTARRFKFFGHRWSRDVRSTAAAALRQIPHPRAAAALARFAYYVNRKGPRIVATQRLPDASADAEDASEAAEAKES